MQKPRFTEVQTDLPPSPLAVTIEPLAPQIKTQVLHQKIQESEELEEGGAIVRHELLASAYPRLGGSGRDLNQQHGKSNVGRGLVRIGLAAIRGASGR